MPIQKVNFNVCSFAISSKLKLIYEFKFRNHQKIVMWHHLFCGFFVGFLKSKYKGQDVKKYPSGARLDDQKVLRAPSHTTKYFDSFFVNK